MPDFNDKLIRIDDQNQLVEFLRSPTIAIAEGLTALMSNPGLGRLAAGRIVQAALKNRLFEQIGNELDELRKAGRIKKDYFATHNQQATLHELLNFIDEKPPNEEVFNALKSIFFCAVEMGASAQDELKAYQLLQICNQLRSGDILVLKECWKMYRADPKQLEKERPGDPILAPSRWLEIMSSRMGLPDGLIDVHAARLLELRLLLDTGISSVSRQDCRLSGFGLELCRFITKF